MRTAFAAMTVLLVLAGPGRAGAGLISYAESITTDGSLGGTAFTGELVTLTLTADPSGVVFFQGSNFTQYTVSPLLATVTVAGLGTATFVDPIQVAVFAFPTFSEFAVTDQTKAGDILDTFATTAGFAGVDLKGPFGPVSGGAAYPVGFPFGTSLGDFVFTKSGGGVSTVAGTAVPEPSSLALASLGLLTLLPLRRRAR